MSEATKGTLTGEHKDSGTPLIFKTINFSFVPGTSLLIVVEQPHIVETTALDKDGKEVKFPFSHPPIQRILDVGEIDNLSFISDSHLEAQEVMLAEVCEKLNIDFSTVEFLLTKNQIDSQRSKNE